MGRFSVIALRVVIVLVLAGSVFVQLVMVPLLAIDLEEDFDSDIADVRVPLLVIAVLAFVVVEVVAVCVWRLLTMVRRGTVFSSAAFRWVDIIIGATVAAALLAFALGATLAPGDSAAPGMVLLIGGAGVAVAGIALIILVMRMLLAQAVDRDAEARRMQHELDEVI